MDNNELFKRLYVKISFRKAMYTNETHLKKEIEFLAIDIFKETIIKIFKADVNEEK